MATVLHLQGEILVGPEDVRPEAWVVGGRLTFERPTAAGSDVQTLRGWVLPGLVDAHCHVGLDAHGAVDDADRRGPGARRPGGRDAAHPRRRVAGGHAVDRRARRPAARSSVRAGTSPAPAATSATSPTRSSPTSSSSGCVSRRRPATAGSSSWATGSTATPGTCRPAGPSTSLTDAIAAAHEEGARVTAHCFGEASLYDFAAAGTDCIEHATGLEPETIAQFAEQQIAIVPTLVNIATFPAIAEPAKEKFPDYHRRMIALHERRYDTIGAARDAGIPIYLGTDAGGSLRHGLVADEAHELTKAGMSNAEALYAATWGARAWLGRPGLEEGADADLVVYAADPRREIRALAAPEHVVLRGTEV